MKTLELGNSLHQKLIDRLYDHLVGYYDNRELSFSEYNALNKAQKVFYYITNLTEEEFGRRTKLLVNLVIWEEISVYER